MPNEATQTLTKGGLNRAAEAVTAMDQVMTNFNRTTLADLLDQQAQLANAQKEVANLDDASVKAARLQIIEADMAKLNESIAKYRDDTAELIAGLEATFESLGQKFESLRQRTPEDNGLVEAANQRLETLKTNAPVRISELEAVVRDAETAWNPFGRAERVQDAKRALERFTAQNAIDISEAEKAIVEVEAEVERRRRARIREADFDAQFERFLALAQEIQSKLLENVRQSEVRMAETQNALNQTLQQKADLADQIANLDKEIAGAEEIVIGIENRVSNAVDQKARSDAEQALGVANQKLADLNGTRQEMQVAFNALDTASIKHGNMLQSLQVQRDNQRSHARKLMVDSKARFQQAQNLVTIIQNTAQEDAASRLHSVGSSMDRTSMQIAAQALVASERERIRMLEGFEQDRIAFGDITGALAEGRAAIAIKDAEIAARMQKNFGIDPLQSSWLHLAQQQAQPPQQ